jgi:hypothetical protein
VILSLSLSLFRGRSKQSKIKRDRPLTSGTFRKSGDFPRVPLSSSYSLDLDISLTVLSLSPFSTEMEISPNEEKSIYGRINLFKERTSLRPLTDEDKVRERTSVTEVSRAKRPRDGFLAHFGFNIPIKVSENPRDPTSPWI